MQAIWPARGWYELGPHSRQVSVFFRLKDPAAHGVQLRWPLLATLPARHIAQRVAPSAGWYARVGQGRHWLAL